MKKLKTNFKIKTNKLISYILALLGFSYACIPTPVEYGMPHADFKINGTVESALNSQKIKNIEVRLEHEIDTTLSDGSFQLSAKGYFPETQTFILEFRDIDGAENGEFQDLDTTITFENPDFVNGDGDWYYGETEKTINIKLKPKN